MSLWKRLWVALPRLGIAGLVIAFIAFIGVVYFTEVFPNWTGFGPPLLDAQGKEIPHEKTLWDWLGLVLIPFVLAIGGFFLTRSENRYALQLQERREAEARKIEEQRILEARKIEEQRTQDAALQAYLDQMTQLLLHENLRTSQWDDEVRSVARARTLTVLRVLDGVRKGIVLRFLYEASLIGYVTTTEDGTVVWIDAVVRLGGINLAEAALAGVDLAGAFIPGVDLKWTNLRGANLYRADFHDGNLEGARLEGANLQGAHLAGTGLSYTHLEGANLEGANLGGARLGKAHLEGARLEGADLWSVKLRGADLTRANLKGVDLRYADLTNCKVTREQLAQAGSLEGAKLPFDIAPPAPEVEVAAQKDQAKE